MIQKKDEAQKDQHPLPTYTDGDLFMFDEWLQQFRVTKDVSYPKKEPVSFVDLHKAAIGYGAATAKGIIPGKYEKFMDKLDQLEKLKARTHFAQERDMEGIAAFKENLVEATKVW